MNLSDMQCTVTCQPDECLIKERKKVIQCDQSVIKAKHLHASQRGWTVCFDCQPSRICDEHMAGVCWLTVAIRCKRRLLNFNSVFSYPNMFVKLHQANESGRCMQAIYMRFDQLLEPGNDGVTARLEF